jgi:hypothetical protein
LSQLHLIASNQTALNVESSTILDVSTSRAHAIDYRTAVDGAVIFQHNLNTIFQKVGAADL